MKLGENDGVKFLAWKSGGVKFWTNSMSVLGKWILYPWIQTLALPITVLFVAVVYAAIAAGFHNSDGWILFVSVLIFDLILYHHYSGCYAFMKVNPGNCNMINWYQYLICSMIHIYIMVHIAWYIFRAMKNCLKVCRENIMQISKVASIMTMSHWVHSTQQMLCDFAFLRFFAHFCLW